MPKAPIPSNASILVEVGTDRPTETSYEAVDTYQICWVITNGDLRRKYLWINRRPSGFYIALGMPRGIHTTYHQDGKRHWKIGSGGQRTDLKNGLPFDSLSGAVLVQNATTSITDDTLDDWELAEFNDEDIDRVFYLDNRQLPDYLYYEVFLVEPFKHSEISLHTDKPVHFHLLTHTLPWIAVLIYEGG